MGQMTADFTVSLNGNCPKQTATFFNTSTQIPGSALFIWNFGNGTIDTTRSVSDSVNETYSANQNYQVTLTVQSGGQTATQSRTLSIEALTQSFALGASRGCLPLTDTLTNTSQLGGRTTSECFWDFGDGTTLFAPPGSDSPVLHTYQEAGTKTVQMTLLTTSGCVQYLKQSIVVPSQAASCSGAPGGSGTVTGQGNGVHASFTYTNQFVVFKMCLPEVFYFASTSTNAAQLAWDFGDGATAANVTNPSHSYKTPGTFYVRLTATGADASVSSTTDTINVYAPSATVQANIIQTCGPAEITLRATGVINTTQYSWNFGDGVVSNEPDSVVTHRYAVGTYSPMLTLWDSVGCTGNFGLAAPLVFDSLHASIQSSTRQVCDSALVQFSAGTYSISKTSLGDPLTYQWAFDTDSSAYMTSIANPALEYRTPGMYKVSLTVKSVPGCQYTYLDTIRVAEKPKGFMTGPSKACSGAPLSFSAFETSTPGGPVASGTGSSASGTGSSSPGSLPNWDWILPGGPADTAQTISFSIPKQGQYMVALVMGLNGCFDTVSAPVSIYPLPDLTLSPQDPRICLGDSLQLTATGGTSYQWSPSVVIHTGAGGNSPSGPDNGSTVSAEVTPAFPTSYKVTATNQYGCTATDSDRVFVVRPFSLRLPSDTFVCTGSNVLLEPEGGYTYRWIAGVSGSDSAASAIRVNPAAGTSYTVVASDSDRCFADTATVNVAVEPLPTVQAVPVGTLPAGNSVTLQVTGSADVTSWEWSPADYLSCTDCNSPLSTPQSSITYTVTGKTQYGCTASDSLRIQLICMEDRVSVPNTFTPNNDGFNDVFYPRGKGVRVISSFLIFNRWGNTVFERHNIPLDDAASGWDGKLNGADQPTGSYVYALQIVCDTGDIFALKGTVMLER